jgi:hypothetical protein
MLPSREYDALVQRAARAGCSVPQLIRAVLVPSLRAVVAREPDDER